jgi:xylulokinase
MLLAHDLGTTGNKASLHDDTGRLIVAVTQTYGTEYGPRGVVEQDPDAWWQAVCRATTRLLQTPGVSPDQILGIALSGQMMGAVLLDAAGKPVRPSLIWADTRSGAQAWSESVWRPGTGCWATGSTRRIP